jgi:hypothetical protein
MEGLCDEEWDAVALSRPPTDVVNAKMACDQDPECEGFTHDPKKLVYWKLKNIDPKGFRKGQHYNVYVKLSVDKARKEMDAELVAQQRAFFCKEYASPAHGGRTKRTRHGPSTRLASS